MTEDLKPFLQAGPTVQSDDDAVVGFARRAMGTETRAVDQAVLLYYAVRDEVRYDGYDLDISVEGLCAGVIWNSVTAGAFPRLFCLPPAAVR